MTDPREGKGALPLDAYALAERLLPGVPLTSGQLAQVRAADVKRLTELHALRERARGEGRAWEGPSAAEREALLRTLLDDLRSMLADDRQREEFERNLARARG